MSPQAAGPPKDGDAAEKTEDNQLAALARRFEEKYGVRIGQGERHGKIPVVYVLKSFTAVSMLCACALF